MSVTEGRAPGRVDPPEDSVQNADAGTGDTPANVPYATEADVLAALRRLTDLSLPPDDPVRADLARLRARARVLLPGTGYRDPQDLVGDTIDSVILGAQSRAVGERKGRAWRTDVAFTAHLFRTLQGVASDARRSKEHKVIVHGEAGHEERHVNLETPEEMAIAAQTLAELKRDDECRAIVEGLAEGLTAAQIRRKNNMTELAYDNADRRLRRLRQKVRGGL
jgi:hypothetical protein